MKIGIDARWIFPQISGIGRYTQELIRHLAEIDHHNEYVLYFGHEEVRERTEQYAQLHQAPNFSSVILPYGLFSVTGQFRLPAQLRRDRVEVYHAPNFMIPFKAFPREQKGSIACVVTIHDLIPLLYPGHTPRALKTRFHSLFKRILREAGRRADAIITVSESSRNDIIQHMHIPAHRQANVIAIPEGVASDYQPGPRAPRNEKVILYVGRMDPYKNVRRLIEAFSLLIQGPVPDTRLHIIGARDPRYPEAENLIQSLHLVDKVDWPGYVSGDALRQAYHNADVFVLVSLYEGFGLPVLEAMASGTPVICSNRASLPEVAGNAARIVDPDNIEELVQALTDVLTQPDLSADLREKGLQRAAQFSWRRTAEETVKVYTELTDSQPAPAL